VTGFIRGIFGSQPKADQPAQEKPKVKEKAQKEDKSNEFYLPFEEAQTFGNLDYMKKSVKTRRTFPKAKVGEDNEFVQEVSAMEQSSPSQPKTMAPEEKAIAPSPTQANAETSERRRSDSSMDMFRNMARDMKKG
jgi:hypothetical protein